MLIGQGQAPVASEQLRKIYKGKIIAAGGFEPDSAEAIVEKGDADLVTFGRYFVSNLTCQIASSGDCRSTITTATHSTPSMLTVIPTTRSTTCAPPHRPF